MEQINSHKSVERTTLKIELQIEFEYGNEIGLAKKILLVPIISEKNTTQ